MKRIIIYCLILAGTLAIPVKKTDVGKLKPVQAVWISKQNGQIVLQTDTGDTGAGRTVGDALADMEAACLGIIYLDTAQFLLVSENALDQIPALRQHLKGSVKLCQWEGKGSISDAAKYMSAHEIGCPLKAWDVGVNLPILAP